MPGKRLWSRDPPGLMWLPELGKFLPDTWCDESLISDKAVKADEDPAPEHLWANRTRLVIPLATHSKGFQTLPFTRNGRQCIGNYVVFGYEAWP
jgi:hypothetical protein